MLHFYQRASASRNDAERETSMTKKEMQTVQSILKKEADYVERRINVLNSVMSMEIDDTCHFLQAIKDMDPTHAKVSNIRSSLSTHIDHLFRIACELDSEISKKFMLQGMEPDETPDE